jgi:hypothetical protein
MKSYSRCKFIVLFAAMLLLLGIRLAVSGSRADEIPLNSAGIVLLAIAVVALSKVGYRDVTPVSRPARSLACLEAICGQFYLAVLVAGLIGIGGTKRESETAEAQQSR